MAFKNKQELKTQLAEAANTIIHKPQKKWRGKIEDLIDVFIDSVYDMSQYIAKTLPGKDIKNRFSDIGTVTRLQYHDEASIYNPQLPITARIKNNGTSGSNTVLNLTLGWTENF